MSTEKLVAAVRLLLATSGPKTEQQYECWKPLKEGLAELESAVKPAVGPVASIYITADGEREFDDWKCALPVGRTELYLAPAAPAPVQAQQADADLAMMLRRCASALQSAGRAGLQEQVLDLLRRKGLQGSPLREAQAEAKPAPAVDPCLALWQAMNEAEKYGQRTDDKLIVKFLREAGYVIAPAAPATLTDEQIADALVAGGVELQRFMGGIAGTKDCWTTAGSADVRKIAAVVRGIAARKETK